MTKGKAKRLREKIEQASVSLPDADALEAVELFPAYAVGVAYKADFRFRYDEKLYRVLQAHTSQEDWPPDETQALYTEVAKPGQGDSQDNPIHYDNNTELVEGKYYEQGGVVYVCFRSTGIPVYNDLKDLVNLYVHVCVEQ